MARHSFFCVDAHTDGNPVRRRSPAAVRLFDCRVEAAAVVGSVPAIRPSVAGWARVTGYNTVFVDDRDPFAHGFQVG